DVKGSTPFIYDAIDVKDELIYGFTYKLDRLWKVGVRTSYNLNTDEVHNLDYVLTRNLHCFEATIIYRQKRDENRDEWKVRIGLINW
ncbi:MAG: LPS-assembly protein LptD, partial [Bacillota bacterium]